jgi:hypothetical protein
MLIHHSKDAFFSALKLYMTCQAIYWQKARTKRKDIDSSDRLTAVCVCQRIKTVCCSILILLIKTVHCSIPPCI